MGPSTASRSTGALASPNANNRILRDSRIVARPIVMACVGTLSTPKKVTGSNRPCDRVQRTEPRSAVANAERFVESDMTVPSDPQ